MRSGSSGCRRSDVGIYHVTTPRMLNQILTILIMLDMPTFTTTVTKCILADVYSSIVSYGRYSFVRQNSTKQIFTVFGTFHKNRYMWTWRNLSAVYERQPAITERGIDEKNHIS